MRTVTRGLIGIISVVFFLGGMAMVTPMGSEAEAGGKFKKHKRVSHKDLAKDHKKLGEWIEKVEQQLADLEGGGGGEGNHTLRWDKILDSTNGDPTTGCDSDRFKCIFGGAAVLDLETGLVWEQSPDTTQRNWFTAIDHCPKRTVGGRKGWHLPMREQLASLVDPSNANPALPTGHPFSNVQSSGYWSATTSAGLPTNAWFVNFVDGVVNPGPKFGPLTVTDFVWCARGGQSFDGNTHSTLH